MVKHMKEYDLFSEKQFGFIAGRSTLLQLLAVLDEWTDILDSGSNIDVAYCDYMKAFDKVSHRHLLHKLKIYKFGDIYIKWIQSFLSNRRQKVLVNGSESEWQPVTSGIPQGSVLGPMLFVLFINDLPEHLSNNSQLFLYADDTKIFRKIESEYDRQLLQEDIFSMCEWSENWLLKFHPDKCKTMTLGQTDVEHTYSLKPTLPPMQVSEAEKDVGVIIDNKLRFDQHISEKVNKANAIVGALRRSFEYLDKGIFIQLYKALIRPHMEYAQSIWSPYRKRDIDIIENVQRRATKMVPGLSGMSYEERLRALKLPTLSYRRVRGDMIEVYKLLNNHYYYDSTQLLKLREGNTTRGNTMKLYKQRPRIDIRKYSFSHRVVDAWNSLPDSVISAKSLTSFEARLDRFWYNQDIKYTYDSKLATGISRTNEELVIEATDSLLPEEDLR